MSQGLAKCAPGRGVYACRGTCPWVEIQVFLIIRSHATRKRKQITQSGAQVNHKSNIPHLFRPTLGPITLALVLLFGRSTIQQLLYELYIFEFLHSGMSISALDICRDLSQNDLASREIKASKRIAGSIFEKLIQNNSDNSAMRLEKCETLLK